MSQDAADENVLDFVPPGLNAPFTLDLNLAQAEEPAPDTATPTQGETLVGYSFNPSGDFRVNAVKLRGARVIDTLLTMPLAATAEGKVDMNHHMIVMEAVKRQMDATMWAVNAITWKG